MNEAGMNSADIEMFNLLFYSRSPFLIEAGNLVFLRKQIDKSLFFIPIFSIYTIDVNPFSENSAKY